MRTGILLLFLFLSGLWDWRTREIPVWLMFGGAAALFSYGFWHGLLLLPNMLGGMLIGFFLFLVAKITGGQIGAGDGIVFLITGITLGFGENFTLLAGSLFLSFLFCLGLILLKKADGKDKIPFLPFVFAAYLMEILLC